MPELAPPFLRRPLAHRGLHDRAAGVIENSRAAVAAAVAAGYGIEIDVQRAADGEAMVFHDETLDRLTGVRGRVADTPAEALGRLRLRGADETIPTLSEILALVAGRAPLLIEVKDQDGTLGPAVGPLETRVAALLASYRGPVAVMSFNPHGVAALEAAAPGVARGLTAAGPDDGSYRGLPDYRRADLSAVADFDWVGASFVSYDHRRLDAPAIAALKARRVPVLCWTVRSAAEDAAARRVADNVTFEGYRPGIPD